LNSYRSAYSGIVMLGIMFAPCVARAGDNSPRNPVLVDEVVATVNRDVITLSEIEQEGLLVLVERKGQAGLAREMTFEYLNQVMEFLINQRILLDEARRLGLPPITARERENLLRGFRQRFSSEEGYLRFMYNNGITEEDIGEVLARHLRVERLKDRKLRSMPEIKDAEIKRYYNKHRLELGGNPLEVVAEAIRLKLLTEQREEFLANWVWELRKRSQVKVLVDLAAAYKTSR